jgi:chemotaxis protein methyltransferase CheR
MSTAHAAVALPPGAFVDAELSEAQFGEISRTVYDVAGIRLRPGKEGLVRSRLARRLRALGAGSYGEYLARVRADATGRELAEMVDALTTNKTSFFREPAHFDYLRERVLPALPAREPLRMWSAGCSTGEEPYSLAMVLRESLPDLARRDVRLLATDISSRVLAPARAGRYADAAVADVPPELLRRHFLRAGGAWEVAPAVRSLVTFARLNLMAVWPMRGPFEAIFCRNVMIYFDKPTQQELVARFHALLAPGGHLFVGHAESLSGIAHGFSYVQPAVYRR